VLDALERGDVALPPEFSGTLDLLRIGHMGHSWGAYTAHAVGGATFDQGVFTDARIRAIVPISPQGAGQFGAFDRGATENTWFTVAIPAYTLVGGAEKDGSANGAIEQPDWRLTPFERYRPAPDKHLSVVPGQDHDDMAGGGDAATRTFNAANARVFFEAYLRERAECACVIGTVAAPEGLDHRRKFEPGSALENCTTTVDGRAQQIRNSPAVPIHP
jgi:predicted dienelactone hydrolase